MSLLANCINSEDLNRLIEKFDKAHTTPVQKVFIAYPAYYEEAKRLLEKCGVKGIKVQSVDPKVIGYLMDEESADECVEMECLLKKKKNDMF